MNSIKFYYILAINLSQTISTELSSIYISVQSDATTHNETSGWSSLFLLTYKTSQRFPRHCGRHCIYNTVYTTQVTTCTPTTLQLWTLNYIKVSHKTLTLNTIHTAGTANGQHKTRHWPHRRHLREEGTFISFSPFHFFSSWLCELSKWVWGLLPRRSWIWCKLAIKSRNIHGSILCDLICQISDPTWATHDDAKSSIFRVQYQHFPYC